MIVLTSNKILQLHQFLMQETGGLDGLRDEALLDSAVQSPLATFDGQELYPSCEEKAAKLGYTLVSNRSEAPHVTPGAFQAQPSGVSGMSAALEGAQAGEKEHRV